MNEKKLTFSPPASKQPDVPTLNSTTQVMKHKNFILNKTRKMHPSHSNDKNACHFNTTHAFLTNTDHADKELVSLQIARQIIIIFDSIIDLTLPSLGEFSNCYRINASTTCASRTCHLSRVSEIIAPCKWSWNTTHACEKI
jgi:hypothetical protein